MKVLEVAVTEAFGERCPSFDEGCPCCQAWEELDKLNACRQSLSLALPKLINRLGDAEASYILHPLRVMAKMQTDQDRIVAVLHDVAEDCPMYSLQSLRRAFGHEVGDALDAITKRTGELYEAYLSRVAANPIARRVKMADIADNCDLGRLGREPTAEDRKRLAKYQGASGYLFSLPSPQQEKIE